MARPTSMVLAVMLTLLAGCGLTAPEAGGNGPVQPPAPQVPPGEVGADGLLSWARLDGVPPIEIISSGGPIPILSFTRRSRGVYELVYDISTADAGFVAPVATGSGGVVLGSQTGAFVIGANQDSSADNLTVEAFAVSSFVNGTSLSETDAQFYIATYGQSTAE